MYSIIKLSKPKYDPEHVTKADPNPRLLVLRVYKDSMQYLVRYPDSFIHRVNADAVLQKTTFEPDHPKYVTVARDMRAVEVEFRKNERYQYHIKRTCPNFATELQQTIDAKHKAYQERQAIPAPTIADVIEIPQPDEEETPSMLPLLQSIDQSLKTLIDLWSTGGN